MLVTLQCQFGKDCPNLIFFNKGSAWSTDIN